MLTNLRSFNHFKIFFFKSDLLLSNLDVRQVVFHTFAVRKKLDGRPLDVFNDIQLSDQRYLWVNLASKLPGWGYLHSGT